MATPRLTEGRDVAYYGTHLVFRNTASRRAQRRSRIRHAIRRMAARASSEQGQTVGERLYPPARAATGAGAASRTTAGSAGSDASTPYATGPKRSGENRSEPARSRLRGNDQSHPSRCRRQGVSSRECAGPEAITDLCRQLGAATTTIGVLVTNQPNRTFLRNWPKALQPPAERHRNTFDQYRNTFGAAIPITLDRAAATASAPPAWWSGSVGNSCPSGSTRWQQPR
ncbi:3-oxoacyl-[acyl-carrier-protein] synthase III C-terminal domain-containing protein [Streptomyces sp. NPDC020362]|uniref:3-oxoacyl-[acyl-carrier-protein] synthase III C-terminal domain-containing protein n=1 Tax=unclassified Streptomyces TaxID=2593676 RepID=UPI0033EF1A05